MDLLIALLGFMAIGVLVIAIVFGVLIYLLAGGGRRGDAAADAQVAQDLFVALEKMEKRIDSLETILIDGQPDNKKMGD